VLVVAPAAQLAEVIPQPHGQDFLHYRLKAGNGTTGTGTGRTFTSVAWNHQAGRTPHTGAAE
jgi:hypothetical protein